MEFDLTRNLRDLSEAPEVPADAVHLAAVRTRVRRGRTLRVAGTALGAAAAVLVVGAVVYAAPWRPTPPAESPKPAPTVQGPTPTPDATPSTEPTPDPTPEPTPERTAFALTAAGDLVELDPESGSVIRTVATNEFWSAGLSITPDREFAYVEAGYEREGGPEWPGEIHRVSLADGTSEVAVTSATSPAVSPDGRALAYLSIEVTGHASARSLTVQDLTTGAVIATIPDDQCVECERVVSAPTWTPDSSALVLGLGWFDAFPGVVVRAVDPTVTPTLEAGRLVGPANDGDVVADWYGRTAFTADGTLLVPAEEGTAEQWQARGARIYGDGPDAPEPTSLVAEVDPATGEVVSRIPVDGTAVAVAAAPTGVEVLVLVSPGLPTPPSLFRWDGSTLAPLGDGYTAVAW